VRSLVAWILLLVPAVSGRTPAERLSDGRLEAVRAQRIEWKMKRARLEAEGVYQDYRAVFLRQPAAPAELLLAAKEAEVQVVIGAKEPAARDGVLFLKMPEGFSGVEIHRTADLTTEEWKKIASKAREHPNEALGAAVDPQASLLGRYDQETGARAATGYATVDFPSDVLGSKRETAVLAAALRTATTHILARDLSEPEIRDALKAGRAYVSHDWLCDPRGFGFVAQNYLGVFDMGDDAPLFPAAGDTNLLARTPVPAKFRLLRNGTRVTESQGTEFVYAAKQEGAYRLEVALDVDGEERPWIYSNAVFIRRPWDIWMPSSETPPNVTVHPDITYTDGKPGDAGKHKLDLYLPKDKQNFPVLLFVHGGSWRTGDRSLYKALGNRLARAGIGVAIPSYRLMTLLGGNKHPAQAEDVAAAFAWVYQNIEQYGGDRSRFYVGGHSAGGHLVSLLALDGRYLQPHDLTPDAIRGVISISGVYDLSRTLGFIAEGDKRDASPIRYVRPRAPRFFVSYCQWDYLTLPRQAREFAAALKKAFVETDLIYIPGDNHITEIINLTREDGPLLHGILDFLQ
jgi:acetyl esterase/lipase